jgi:hypothetical protein
MIEIKYETQMSGAFITAAKALVRARFKSFPVAYNVRKMGEALNASQKKIVEEFQTTLLPKFANKDAEGKVVLDKDGEPDFTTESKEAFIRAQEEFGKRVSKIDRLPLYIGDLETIKVEGDDHPGFTSFDAEALAPILCDHPGLR